MEVCGGHTHSIYKYGVDDLLPDQRRARPRPRLPGLRDPDGPRRRRHRDRPRARRDLHLLRRHAARPGLATARCSTPRPQGADVRMVYSPLDALRIARENPDRDVVFFAIGFETTAPSTALTLKRAKADGVSNFFCMCNHVTIVPPLRALLDSPDLRLDGFIGPGHVSTVVGARPFEFIPADYGRPVVIAGLRAARPAAGDPDDPAPARRRPLRGREPVQARRAARGQPARARGDGRGVRAAPALRVARAGLHLPERAAPVRRLRGPRRRAALRGPGRARRRPQGVPVRRGAQGRHQAVGVQGVRHGVHARARRSARAWSRPRAPAPPTTTTGASRASARWCEMADGAAVSDREERILGIIETARAKRPKFKDAQITMAHGAGGKATPDPDRGPARAGVRLGRAGDAGRRRHRHGRRSRPRA